MKRTIILLVILGYFGVFLLVTLGLGYYWFSTKRTPEQPIAFPHTIHVSELALECDFCHIFVEKSRHAGIISVEECMYCHGTIATEREEIKKLSGYYYGRKPIEWNRIYSLPDYVYFSHKRHVKAEVACSVCHGDVAFMKKIRRVRSLKMGWCVSCHRDRNASLDCATCHH